MNVSEARFTVLLSLALLILAAPGPLAAQSTGAPAVASHGSVRGTVVDQSAGVLPGVTVVAAIEGRMLGVTQTNAAGEFSFDGLPAGSVDLSFRLDGFDDSRV
ncbi:MAG: carboxypeptidase regulatory-like domain-containing protein, partial [Acidobacteria bacterium]|nr:carboxypeptidase regulatory-like domain-containing protein [Acidobacteriota bacterium]